VQVYRLFFGSFPLVPDETRERDLWDGFGPGEQMSQLEVRSVRGTGWGRARPLRPLRVPSASCHGGSGGARPSRGDATGR